MRFYIGLDAHSRTCTAVVVNEAGEVEMRSMFVTSESALIGFLSKIPGEKHLRFEE